MRHPHCRTPVHELRVHWQHGVHIMRVLNRLSVDALTEGPYISDGTRVQRLAHLLWTVQYFVFAARAGPAAAQLAQRRVQVRVRVEAALGACLVAVAEGPHLARVQAGWRVPQLARRTAGGGPVQSFCKAGHAPRGSAAQQRPATAGGQHRAQRSALELLVRGGGGIAGMVRVAAVVAGL